MACHLGLISWIFVLAVGSSIVMATADNMEYKGCYGLTYALQQSYHHHVVGVTFAACVNECIGHNMPFAGIEQSDNFCYCGGLDMIEESSESPVTMCSVPCRDDQSRKCGGDWLMSVYDIRSQEETTTENISISTQVPDGANLGFLVTLSNGVRFINSSTQLVTAIVPNTETWYHNCDYHYAKQLAFMVASRTVYRSSLNGDTTPTKIATITECRVIAVDWIRDLIYWADCLPRLSIIKTMDLNGNDHKRVAERPSSSASSGLRYMNIDPFKRMLFWAADGIIESCDLNTNTIKYNISDKDGQVRAMSLDLESHRIYYILLSQTENGVLHSMDYQGLTAKRHMGLEQMRNVYGLGVLGGVAYWVNYAQTRDVLYSAQLDFNPQVHSINNVTTFDRSVWYMRVVHPDLQKPLTDPCVMKDCSDGCVLSSRGQPTCFCHSDRFLDTDGRTCRNPCDGLRCLSGCTASNASYAVCTCPDGQFLYTDLVTCLDPCANKGCQHDCFAVSFSSALCTCPDGFIINTDSKTCRPVGAKDYVGRRMEHVTDGSKASAHSVKVESSPSSAPLVWFIIVVLCALVLLIAALYTVRDRYWTQLRGKLSGGTAVSYAREREQSPRPQFETAEDNVHLI